MKTRSITLLAALGLLISGSAFAAKSLEKITCPVSKKPVKEEHAVAYKEASVYFCCPNCPKAFTKDTAKFAAKANHQLVATKQAKQIACPLSGQKTVDSTAVKIAGTEVKFCCEKCQGKVAKAKDDEQITLAFNDKAFEKAFKVDVDDDDDDN